MWLSVKAHIDIFTCCVCQGKQRRIIRIRVNAPMGEVNVSAVHKSSIGLILKDNVFLYNYVSCVCQ